MRFSGAPQVDQAGPRKSPPLHELFLKHFCPTQQCDEVMTLAQEKKKKDLIEHLKAVAGACQRVSMPWWNFMFYAAWLVFVTFSYLNLQVNKNNFFLMFGILIQSYITSCTHSHLKLYSIKFFPKSDQLYSRLPN